MQAIRHLLAQRHLAVLICAAALLLKLLVPTGYMIDSDHGKHHEQAGKKGCDAKARPGQERVLVVDFHAYRNGHEPFAPFGVG